MEKIVKDTSQVAADVRALYEITARLEAQFPGTKFTPDGHLVGSIGEVLAADAYGLTLLPNSAERHDATAPDGRQVQIKITQGRVVSLSLEPDYLLVLHLEKDGTWQEVYNGPGAVPWAHCARNKLPKNGQRRIGLHTLAEMNRAVPAEKRIPRRGADGKEEI